MADELTTFDPAAAQAAAEAAAAAEAKTAADALAASLAEMAAINAQGKPTVIPTPATLTAPANKAGVVGFGPTFDAELQAAGVFGMLFTWSADHVTFDPAIPAADRAKVSVVVTAHNPDAVPIAVPPDCESLAFWLTALDLWQRKDANGNTAAASAQVQKQIASLVSAGNPAGTLASRQFSNANTVLRTDLLKIASAFGFSIADCDESLWRASQVAQGDLTGVWPLSAA